MKTFVSFTTILAVAGLFAVSAQAQNTFPATGKVGISTTNPTRELEVVGETKLKGDAEIIGKTTLTGSLNVSGVSELIGTARVGGTLILDSLADAQVIDDRMLTITPLGTVKALNSPYYVSANYLCKQTSASPNPIAFWRAAPSKLYIDCPDNTKVGILTDNPLAELDVAGTGLFQRVGIGVTTPLSTLHVEGDLRVGPVVVKGSIRTHSSLQALELFGNVNETDGAYIKAYHNNAINGKAGNLSLVANSAVGGSIQFLSYNGNSWNTHMQINGDGQVGINTLNVPAGYKLAVRGKVACEEVLVQNHGFWPDYVFDSTYQLLPLTDLETYVNENKHLPGIPTAQQVEGGIELAEMNRLLLEKIEELTLHVVQLNNRVLQLEGGGK